MNLPAMCFIISTIPAKYNPMMYVNILYCNVVLLKLNSLTRKSDEVK